MMLNAAPIGLTYQAGWANDYSLPQLPIFDPLVIALAVIVIAIIISN